MRTPSSHRIRIFACEERSHMLVALFLFAVATLTYAAYWAFRDRANGKPVPDGAKTVGALGILLVAVFVILLAFG